MASVGSWAVFARSLGALPRSLPVGPFLFRPLLRSAPHHGRQRPLPPAIPSARTSRASDCRSGPGPFHHTLIDLLQGFLQLLFQPPWPPARMRFERFRLTLSAVVLVTYLHRITAFVRLNLTVPYTRSICLWDCSQPALLGKQGSPILFGVSLIYGQDPGGMCAQCHSTIVPLTAAPCYTTVCTWFPVCLITTIKAHD
ncbi:hypothetical protein PYCCODRAFT_1083387 [Trametes coccinea BRFM310]|uniref:Uncharacterized protein n=1 Tax=Trametes coccinea (strain BRFM310) TaxID=1353009 RepID=A0A1Y2IYK5_TRAC3|nr:hypothetical protein PYCCODRAFT_1083387 [Trametes coccinea BRFM310]